jgi:hypothetical protein
MNEKTPGAARASARLGRRLGLAATAAVIMFGASLAPAHAATAKPTLMPVKGYKYVTAPASFDLFVNSLVSTGLIASAVIKGAADKKDVQEVVLLAQYKAKTTKTLDKTPLKKLLDGAVLGMQAQGGTKAKDYAMVGTHVRAMTIAGVTIVVAYIKTGKLLEVFGPSAKSTLNFVKLYLTSAKAHHQKLG